MNGINFLLKSINKMKDVLKSYPDEDFSPEEDYSHKDQVQRLNELKKTDPYHPEIDQLEEKINERVSEVGQQDPASMDIFYHPESGMVHGGSAVSFVDTFLQQNPEYRKRTPDDLVDEVAPEFGSVRGVLTAMGVPAKSIVTLYKKQDDQGSKSPMLGVRYETPRYGLTAHRGIVPNDRVVHNYNFGVDKRGNGVGSRILAAQVGNSRDFGYRKIKISQAAGGGPRVGPTQTFPPYSGYYVWPLLGFDKKLDATDRRKLIQEINKGNTDIHREMRRSLGGMLDSPVKDEHIPETFHQLAMKNPRFWDFWIDYGDSLSEIEFNLHPESVSSRVFDAYQKRKGIYVPRQFDLNSRRRKK
jgi:hypothetical protein